MTTTTVDFAHQPGTRGGRRGIACTILAHPEPSRVGERTLLGLGGRFEAVISRTAPLFGDLGGIPSRPLDTARVSRRAVTVAVTETQVTISTEADRADVVAEDQTVVRQAVFDVALLERGLVLQVGSSVALLLHRVSLQKGRQPRLGLVGESDAIESLRTDLVRVADLEVPVLLRGASGAGKELAARALHSAGKRAAGPFVALNMAAVTESLAASELFGHMRGSFSGAASDHPGAFERANGGVLFLDEIGDTPALIQPMLLRTLETSEYLPVGGRAARKCDVRVVAATDLDLEEAVASNRFRVPLLHRLAGFTLRVPTLQERPDDIARLAYTFFIEELRTVGEEARLVEHPGEPTYLSGAFIAELVRYPWPGNVRQLRNVIRQLVIQSRGKADLNTDGLSALLTGPRLKTGDLPTPVSAPSSAASPEPTSPRVRVTDDELVDSLRAHGWRRGETAKALGIARSTLYLRIDQCPLIRKANSIGLEELRKALEDSGGDLGRASEVLQVSGRGLRLRAGELGLALGADAE